MSPGGQPFTNTHDQMQFDKLMQYAQGLISALVCATSDMIEPGIPRQNGLIKSQLEWRRRKRLPLAEAGSPVIDDKPKPPDDPSRGESGSLGGRLYEELSLIQTPLKVFLMTSAAVMIFLIFLIWLRKLTMGNTVTEVATFSTQTFSWVDASVVGSQETAAVLSSCQMLEGYLGVKKFEPYDWLMQSRGFIPVDDQQVELCTNGPGLVSGAADGDCSGSSRRTRYVEVLR
ncbi:hypothetical protein GQ53DRAFT_775033 [Thozetella sp. PMI_491]|nr:hypothetical protein GQ53DRAFT_775033 [Thozetella sp. PMI_491]